MKKITYIAPEMNITEVQLEGMIAASINVGVNGGQTVGAGGSLVNEQGNWDIWSGK